MISTKLEVEADFDDFMESETMSTTTESSVENQGGRNRGGTEPEKKMKKMRSIKLSRMPSARKGKSLPSQVHAGYAASLEKSTPMEMSDASPNHVKATSSSDGKEDNFPVLPLRLARRSSFKPVRTVTRKSSMKIRRSQLRKPSGGADLNKKLKKSRSIKHASSESSKSLRRGVNSQDDQHPIIPSSEVDSSPHFLKGTSSSESSFDSSDQVKKISTNKAQKVAYPGNKSIRVSRTSTLGPMRILTKMASMKSKRPSMKKCSDVSSISDPSLDRATCSSTLKDSKFPNRLEVKPRGIDSDGTAAVLNVCRYSYCSLHGHHHGNNPPLKKFVSMRRRVAKTQKSLKPESQSSGKAKRSGNRKKGLQTEKRAFDGDVGVALQQTTDDIRETPSVLGEAESSYPNPSHEANLHQSSNPQKEGNIEASGIGAEHFKEMPSTPSNGEQALRDVNEDTASHLNLEENKGDSQKDVKKLETVSTEGGCELPNSLFSSTGIMEKSISASPEKNGDSELEHRILQPEDTLVASTIDVAGKAKMENQKNFKFWKLIYRHMVTDLDAEFETQNPLSRVDSEEQVQNLHNAANEKNESSQDISQTDPVTSLEDYEASSRKLELTQSDAIKLVQQAFDKILSEIPDHSSDDQSSIASDAASDQDFLLEKQNEGKEVSISTSSISREDSMARDQEEKHLPTDNIIAPGEVKAAEMKGKKSDKQMPNSWSNLKKMIILNRFVKSLEKVRNLKPRATRYLPAHKDPEAEKIHLKHQDMKGRKSSEEWMLDHALRQVISTLAPSQKRKVSMLVQAFESVIPLSESRNDMRPNAEVSSPISSVAAYDEPSVRKVDNAQNETGSEILPGEALNPEMSSKNGEDQDNESHTAHQKFQKSASELRETSLLCDCTEQLLCIAASEMSGTDMKNEDTGAVHENNGNEVSKIVMDDPQKLVDLTLSETVELGVSSDKSFNDEDADRISQEKVFPLDEEVIERNTKEEMPILESEVCSGVSELNIKNMDLENHDLINSADHHGKTESPTEVGERAQPKYKFLCYPLEQPQSESSFAADVSKSERQKYTRLWYLIYKHMVSSSSTGCGLQPVQNGADEEVQGDDASKFSGESNADCQGAFAAGQDMSSQNIEYHNNEIIKLVEEAIDEIPLPEIQDNASDNQSLNGDATLDQELPEKIYGKEEVQFISSSTGSANEDSKDDKNVTAELRSTLNSEEENLKSEIISTQNEAIRGTEEGNKSKKRVLRNWSNLKKLILLRRFVKALEKVREFNPRGPRYLPLEPAPESEKVLLRPQNMEDRKNAEEWMLDYALQRVVAKLTPERKRRVELLVEAFETVIPTLS
ncbi:hypothetical protein COLO4_34259 [Corchorus olitorius]|uniref:Calmodulin-binding domain-containing protein n=1 Tax=Corchorus olitorius TaxID=93759 RepID=A0A1R3GMH0_9ROSI|nr:hypothetical protein COLO4_34259 [Corchorus olitorius]